MSCGPASVLMTRAGMDEIGGACRRSALRKVKPSICGMFTSTITRSNGSRQQLLQRLDAVQRLVDLEAGALQRVAVVAADQVRIVDDEDALARRLSHVRLPCGRW